MIRPSRPLFAALLALSVTVLARGHAQAQTADAAAGAALGLVGGAVVSMAVITGSARAGHYLFSPSEARWQLLPTVAGAVGGGVMGHRNADRLWRSAGYAGLGVVAGGLLGAAVGRLAWGSGEGPWAGAILGAGAGLLAGAVTGALTWEGEQVNSLTLFSLRLAVP